MTENFLERLLCLPSADVSALKDGQLICVLPKVQIQQGLAFLLYPMIEDELLVSDKYRPICSEIAKVETLSDPSQDQELKVWAICEFSTILHDESQLKSLAILTIWTEEFLKRLFQEQNHLFCSHLRVYQVSEAEPIFVPRINLLEKLGKFIGLSTLYPEQAIPRSGIKISQISPVISESIFAKRKKQLEELSPPEYPRLEELQSQITQLISIEPKAKSLDRDLRGLLGWSISHSNSRSDPDIAWIRTIADVGNSSDGDRFEKLVRQSLIKLGFSNSLNMSKASLDPDATGGAGGIDVYCNEPFQLIGECKATKHENVSNSVSAQLIHLGNTHLGKDDFDKSVKVIFAAGNLTDHAEKAANANHMNVMRPETLQRLVELKASYPGSINLKELEICLRNGIFGAASDQKVNNFIDQVQHQIKLRAKITQLVRSCQERLNAHAVSSNEIHTAYAFSSSVYPMNQQEILEILIELSSPLTGYIGHIKGTESFYFLRELLIE